LLEELEYLKIETRLIDEKFVSVMGEIKRQTNFPFELGRESRAAVVEKW
jgi:hypothetical protein